MRTDRWSWRSDSHIRARQPYYELYYPSSIYPVNWPTREMDALGPMLRHERQSHFPSLRNVEDDDLRRRESQPIFDGAIRGHKFSRLGRVVEPRCGSSSWIKTWRHTASLPMLPFSRVRIGSHDSKISSIEFCFFVSMICYRFRVHTVVYGLETTLPSLKPALPFFSLYLFYFWTSFCPGFS